MTECEGGEEEDEGEDEGEGGQGVDEVLQLLSHADASLIKLSFCCKVS